MYYARIHPNTIHVIGELFEETMCFVGFYIFIFSKKCRRIFKMEWKKSCLLYKSCIVLGVISSIICGVVLPIMIIYVIYFVGV